MDMLGITGEHRNMFTYIKPPLKPDLETLHLRRETARKLARTMGGESRKLGSQPMLSI